MERNSSMENQSSESKELGQRNQSQEGSREQMSDTLPIPGINISDRIQPLRPVAIYPFQMGSTSGQGLQHLQPTPEYLRILENLRQPTSLFPQRPLEFNIHPSPTIPSDPLHRRYALPHYQHSYYPYHQLPMRPIGQQHIQEQLQPQYPIVSPYVMNRTPGSQFSTMRNIPDLPAQGRLTLQPHNYPQPFQYSTMLSQSEGQYSSVMPGTGIRNVPGGEEVLTTNLPVVAIYDKDKGHPSSSSANTNIHAPPLSVDLESGMKEMIPRLLEGAQIKVLAIECNFLNFKKQTDLFFIIKYCPNVEKLKLKFKGFRIQTYKPELMSFTNERFECSPLKNLSTFEFISDIACQPNHASTTLKFGMEFFENVYKEIVKSSENLKYLVIRTSKLVGYLEAMTGNLEIANKFNHLHTLRLWTDVNDVELVNIKALLTFLPIVSSSLEILHLSHFTSIDLSSYPLMAKLRTIIIESVIKHNSLNVSTSSLPRLRNLIFRHEMFLHLNVEVGWPFNEDIFKPDQVGNGISEDIIPSPLNVVLYADWRLINIKEAFDLFLQKISQARVTQALFIEFSSHVFKEQDTKSMIKKVLRYLRNTPSLKRCLIRTAETSEGPPKVIDVMKLR